MYMEVLTILLYGIFQKDIDVSKRKGEVLDSLKTFQDLHRHSFLVKTKQFFVSLDSFESKKV